MSTSKLPILAEVAIFSAIALVFDKIPLFTMPQGGSVSLVMLPILLLALRHGLGVGVLTGGIVGTIQLFYGGYFLNVFQVFLDYALSYAGIGLAGLVAPALSKQKDLKHATLIIGLASFLGGSIRLVATFLSGIIFYADYAPAGTPVWLYSFTYNISYILPSTAIASILLILLYRARPGFYNL
ncbi:TPA: energy-coupled thiamine transporter ThiT [Streptococcus suis]|uniref:energy-coupled thiamine transporter ThiT n=1 Tax=Streptococcus suis TaxID=1307 RepID=UPI001ABE0665|nr:energy-coupled thiamine transporter ThiT [Streptococcus suis]MBO4109330.1 energy-coupled thiamine transporter ThiT [Streptococcus suis]MDG3135470.1 energy-coupled thiamine transporter ThiT [Streptococcus suis]HEM3611623.1 energy-coupled thiamine transporter ThiT [Streptococcus suis]HEM3623223.1 energy-coupled thiamine transporter ThiT [Streptococcus suis]HEM3626497.1 energy-coupled thiamine transporter ThiT [Streptococcus suis]